MLYMVIERFRDGDPVPIYRRVQERGRQLPDGLRYVYELGDIRPDPLLPGDGVDRPELFDEWFAAWSDIVEFELLPVLTSADAHTRLHHACSPAMR